MPQTIVVTVENDYLESLARPRRSLVGVSEMIWNALDAEADSVSVTLTENELDGVSSVEIKDDGHGMTPEDAAEAFAHLGGSWKLMASHSRNRARLLHGKRGQGRWRAFSIGTLVQWITVAETPSGRVRTEITGTGSALTRFELSEPEVTDDPVGTRVSIENVHPDAASALQAAEAADNLTALVALYLERYPSVVIAFRGIKLDPSTLQVAKASYDVPTTDGQTATLTVIEWNRRFNRELLLCDENGITLHSEQPGIQAPDFHFTAYMAWRGFREHEDELGVAAMHPELAPVIESGRSLLREHFQTRVAEHRAAVLEEWKRENVYPYEGEAASAVERVERNYFDVVAVTASRAVNAASDRVGRRSTLHLLRQAIEQSPLALRRVLTEVLELPAERLNELDELLDRTSLTSIIALGKEVADRLDFLAGLRELVFDPATRAAVLERSQLHRILAAEAWIFGDEYTLAVDDEGLSRVLQQHIAILGREYTAEDLEPARLEDGSRGIVDLLLSAAIRLPTQQHEHLVVELKRPSLNLGPDELSQIEQYAHAVARDPRFDTVNVRWNFWLVGTTMTEFVQGRASQPNMPPGIVSQPLAGRVTIWAKTWAQILDDCDHRLKFVQEKLDYQSSRDAGVEYLRRRHEQFLPTELQSQADPAEESSAA